MYKFKPLVSVIMRAYNQARYLEGAIQSVLDQTFTDFELIIVNDGSTDSTEAILNKYQYNERIRVINQENMGRGVAGNVGLESAKGVFIAFLDSDDLWERDFLFQTYNFLNAHVRVDVVYTGWATIDENDRILTEIKISKPKDDYKTEFLYGAIFPINVALTRKKCFDQCGTFDTSITYGEDWHLWTRFAYSNFIFAPINGVLAKYRRHPLNTTQNIPLVISESHKTVDKIFSSIKNNNENSKQIANIFSDMNIACYCYESNKIDEMTNILNKVVSKVKDVNLSFQTLVRMVDIFPLEIKNLYYINTLLRSEGYYIRFESKFRFLNRLYLLRHGKILAKSLAFMKLLYVLSSNKLTHTKAKLTIFYYKGKLI